MFARPADLDEFRAGTDDVGELRLGVERGAELVEVSDLLFGAAADAAAGRFSQTQDQAQQAGLASAVGADDADAVATHQPRREVADHGLVAAIVAAVGECDVLQFGNQATALLALVHAHADLPQALAALRPSDPQVLQTLDPAGAARAPRLDAFTDPGFLLREELVELCGLFGFVLQPAGLAHQVFGEVAGKAHQPATVEFEDAAGDGVEEGAVVGDHHHGAGEVADQTLQPEDAVDVEVVGRLVEQQQIRLTDQRPRQRDALDTAPR